MPHCAIRVFEENDGQIIEQIGSKVLIGDLFTCAILEKGMTSGKTSLMLQIMNEDGTETIVQTSAEIIKGIHACLHCAEQRFIDKQK